MFEILEYLDDLCDRFDNDPDEAMDELLHDINVALGIDDE